MDGVTVAKAILDSSGEAVLEVLSLAPGLPPVTADTPTAEARRNYMRLAVLIHPDKIKDRFEKATEAFQKLVHAFEVLADPKSRKRLVAQQAKAAKQPKPPPTKEKKTTITDAKPIPANTVPDRPVPSKSKPKSAPKEKRKKPRATPKARDEADDDFIVYDEESEETDEESFDEADEMVDSDAEPVVSRSRAPIGAPRIGGVYCETAVGCPRCRTPWQPDMKQQYSLFMGPAGKRVHCQLCLLRFGCATALHACPHCHAGFDYDSSQYDATRRCPRCAREFGFAYYPVSQTLVDQVRLEEWREAREGEKAREREERAARRHGGASGDTSAEKNGADFDLLVGQCIVDEQCPICGKRRTTNHRQHVQECMRMAAEKKEKKEKKERKVTTTTAPPKPTPKAAAGVKERTAKKTEAKKTKAKKRRRNDSSDSEDDFIDSDDDY